ncbi:hypothetical protein [Curtobacterium sp. BH-2-1-1]|uniref:hypothetical protein n=1 Tax=Curtobacterium sp. BH-2-1-1 TaxID=1905847 RepID=UPI0012EAE146|nr:hypothetical protein [Curtobacterium sp. BH-2-1-1]
MRLRALTIATAVALSLSGWDATHGVSGVALEDVALDGAPLTTAQVRTNQFVSGVTVS